MLDYGCLSQRLVFNFYLFGSVRKSLFTCGFGHNFGVKLQKKKEMPEGQNVNKLSSWELRLSACQYTLLEGRGGQFEVISSCFIAFI